MSEIFEVGSIVSGKVIKVKPFGAIILLENGKQGLVHISQISRNFVQNIEDHIKIDEEVKVKVLNIDEENGKIGLSIKDALPKPENNNFKNKEQKNNYEPKNTQTKSAAESPNPSSDFEEKMKEWLKQANERQANLNKRANRR